MKNTTLQTLLFAAGCLLLLAAAPAKALDVYGFGSYWDKGDANGKWGMGLGASLPVLTDFLLLDSRIAFYKDSQLDGHDDLTLMPIDLGAQVHILPGSALDPYGMAGVSFIYADADHSDVDSSFGTYLGGGLAWDPFSSVQFFGEVIYRFQELDGGRGEHIDISGFTGNVGVRFSF